MVRVDNIDDYNERLLDEYLWSLSEEEDEIDCLDCLDFDCDCNHCDRHHEFITVTNRHCDSFKPKKNNYEN